MSATLIRGCEVVATMDAEGTELRRASILVADGVIQAVGAPGTAVPEGARVIDGTGCVAVPGLVNTHHHLYQSMTRCRAQSSGLFGWLKELYPTWARLDAEWVHTAALVGLGELALSGCTTSADHHYVFPAGTGDLLAAEVEAARSLGVRLHACRGSMDLGESSGGLPPESTVQDLETVLRETEEAADRYHDPAPGAMVRIASGPCSPFSASPRLMRESARLARRLRIRLHTHLAETRDEEEYCLARFGRTPLDHMEDLEFLGPDVWLAHCVHLDQPGVDRLRASDTAVAWCPTSNLRLGSGLAPARSMLDAGVRVGLAVDGSASNDSGDLLAEARMGLLVARAAGPDAMSAREALRVATRGGAECLGRDDLGTIEPGRRADIALFRVDDLAHAGAADPVASLLLCAPARARHVLVEGADVVRDGRLVGIDEEEIAARGRRLAARIGAGSAAVEAP